MMRLGELIHALQALQTVCGEDAETSAYSASLRITTESVYTMGRYYNDKPDRKSSYWVQLAEYPTTPELEQQRAASTSDGDQHGPTG